MTWLLILAILAASAAPAAEKPAGREGTEKEKFADAELLYALGALLGARVQNYGFSPEELARIQHGFADASAKRRLKLTDVDMEEWGPRVDAWLQRRATPALAKEKERGSALAAAEAKEPGAQTLEGGIVLRMLKAGEGASPSPRDRVRVKYEGRTADGKVFDSSASADVPLDKVVRCWSVALPKLRVGGRARLVCPPATAYGEQGRQPQVPGGATIVFDIELLEVPR